MQVLQGWLFTVWCVTEKTGNLYSVAETVHIARGIVGDDYENIADNVQ